VPGLVRTAFNLDWLLSPSRPRKSDLEEPSLPLYSMPSAIAATPAGTYRDSLFLFYSSLFILRICPTFLPSAPLGVLCFISHSTAATLLDSSFLIVIFSSPYTKYQNTKSPNDLRYPLLPTLQQTT
jgi:hypothetical protein